MQVGVDHVRDGETAPGRELGVEGRVGRRVDDERVGARGDEVGRQPRPGRWTWRTETPAIPRSTGRACRAPIQARMRVLVTGASGFVGGVACEAAAVIGVTRCMALVRRPGSEPTGTTPVAGELADGDALAAAVADAAPDAVLPPRRRDRLAAQRGASRGERRGTRRLLARLRGSPAPRVVFTSTVVTGDAGGRCSPRTCRCRSRPPTAARSRRASGVLAERGLPPS